MIKMYSFSSSLTVIDNNINEIGTLQRKLREVIISKQAHIRKILKKQSNTRSSDFFHEAKNPKIATTSPFESHKLGTTFVPFLERYENLTNESFVKPDPKISRRSLKITIYIFNLLPNKLSVFMNEFFVRATYKLKQWLQ